MASDGVVAFEVSEVASNSDSPAAALSGAVNPAPLMKVASTSSRDLLQSPVRQTVIRLKRRIEDSPSKILLVSCKRLKTDANAEEKCGVALSGESDDVKDDAYTQVLRLVGTVPECEADNNNIASTVKSVLATQPPIPKVAFRRNVKDNASNITEKSRQRFKRGSEESRFKIVNSKRGVEVAGCTTGVDDKCGKGWSEENNLLKLLDLVPESSDQGPKKRSRPAGFEPGNEEAFMDYRDGEDLNEHFVDDDEDSNAEDNWRNDYPDSDEGEPQDDGGAGPSHSYDAGTGEVYGMNFNGLNVKGGGGESSSDDDCIYGIEDDGAEYGISGFDASYARYKNRIRKYEDYDDEVVSISSESD